MKILRIILILLAAVPMLSESLFQVKDSSGNPVMNIEDTGMTLLNGPDTLMTITNQQIKAFVDKNAGKGLSRSFTVASSGARKDASSPVFSIINDQARMWEGTEGSSYMNFSPYNIFIGQNSGVNTVVNTPYGASNVFLGNNSGSNNISGAVNVFIGDDAGYSNVDNHNNTFIGAGAGYHSTADNNIYIGTDAGFYSQTGTSNIFIGLSAGASNDTGSSNVFIGAAAGYGDEYFSMGTSSNNVCIGDSSAIKNLYGQKNTILGSKSGYSNSSGTGNVFLGAYSGYYETGSNRLYIDNSDTSSPLIYGEFNNDLLRVNGDLDVTGSTTLNSSLDVAGTTALGSTLEVTGSTTLYSNASISGNVGIGSPATTGKLYADDPTPNSDTPALYGRHYVTDYYGVGVRGDGKFEGVMGYAQTATNDAIGVYGIASGSGTGTRYGVYGNAGGGQTAWAGYFDGNVQVVGTLSKGGGSFKIDHPLDPENKYLYHSFVESPDMKNIYDGVAVLDASGQAVVELPEWFEALNDNFRYQLTGIGAPAPNIYVSQEISGNRFMISGGEPGMKVSWMVTGIRKDKFAEANRIPVEEDKADADKGYYLYPEAYGKPENKGIDYKIQSKNKMNSLK